MVKLSHLIIAAAALYFFSKESQAKPTVQPDARAENTIDVALVSKAVNLPIGTSVTDTTRSGVPVIDPNKAPSAIIVPDKPTAITLNDGTTVVSYQQAGVPVTIYPSSASKAMIQGGTLGITNYGAPVYTSGPLKGAAPDSPAAMVWASIVGK